MKSRLHRPLHVSVLVAALWPNAGSVAQTVVSPAKPDYKNEATVIERLDRVYSYAADGTGYRELTGVMDLHTGAAVKTASILNIDFASSSERVEIRYVRVRHPDGSVSETPVADVQEQPAPVTREAPFYSDLKEDQLPVRGLSPGDVLEYNVRIVRTKAEAPNHFWNEERLTTPSRQAVVLEESVELRVPKDVYVQTWSPKHKPEATETATEKVFRWNSSQLLPVAGKKETDLLREDPEALDLDANGDSLPSIAWSNFHTWAEVGAWYRSMEGSRIEPDDEVRDKVKQLIAGKVSSEEKARAIYGYVAPQIRYIGVAFGVGRYQPHEAGDVLRNQYGDCKDKHTLLSAMLSAAGIQSDAALIGSGEAFTDALPSPGWFNHAITLVHVDGKTEWLDATAEVAPYQMLSSSLRGKQALVIPSTGESHLETTAATEPFPFEDRFTAIGSLDEHGVSHSHITMDLRGDGELSFRAAARSVSPAQYDELMQRISQSIGYAGKVTDADFSSPNDTSKAFHVSYQYEREKAGDWDNLRIFPQLPPVGLGPADEKDPPVVPIELGSPHVEIAHAEMKLPAGWGVELPAPIHARSSFATFDLTYKFENGTVVTDRRIEIIAAHLPAAQWKDYEKWYKAASIGADASIQLTRTGGSRPQARFDDEAARKLEEVGELERAKKWDEAQRELDDVKAINPMQATLWSYYASLAYEYGKPSEAAADLQKEIEYHPEEAFPYNMLSSMQAMQNKMDDALATAHKLLVLHPDDETGNKMVARILLARHDDAGAEKALRIAAKSGDASDGLRLEFAGVLLRNQKSGEAKPILLDLASNSQDPEVINGAAYNLAEDSLDLSVAESAEQRASSLLEEAILARSGSERDALMRASLLLSTWDTTGLILLREGKLAEAEPWLRAAWGNGQRDDAGLHLGELLEKQGHREEAATIYVLAEVSEFTDSSPDVRKKLTAHLASMPEGAAAKKSFSDPRGTLQSQRSLKVARPENLPPTWGTISFELASDGSMRNIAPVPGDNTNPAALEKAVAALSGFKLKLAIPTEAKAPLLRQGVLSCHSGPTCDFVLVPPASVLNEP